MLEIAVLSLISVCSWTMGVVIFQPGLDGDLNFWDHVSIALCGFLVTSVSVFLGVLIHVVGSSVLTG